MKALLDGDIVAYRCAATAQNDPEWVATSRTNTLVEQILQETAAKEYQIYLSNPVNFRRKMYPQYKANRTAPPPVHLALCKQYLVEKWGAVWAPEGYEADDSLGINQTSESIICSIDKDLKQIPGKHYNFVKKEFDEVDEFTGWYNFYIQLLVGDSSDNIRGCPGIGKAKAPKILAGCETEQEMFDVVQATYNDDEFMLLNGQLLYILRKENQYWNPASLIKQDRDQPLESTQQTQVENSLSTEHGGMESKSAGNPVRGTPTASS
jgi:5'-3' exonuclease